jgi:hypothetical protein
LEIPDHGQEIARAELAKSAPWGYLRTSRQDPWFGLRALTRTAPYDERVTLPQPPDAHNPADAAHPASRTGPVRWWDIILTGIFLIADVGLTVVVAVFGLYLAEAVSVCGVRDCDDVLVTIGMALATVIPWILLVTAVIVSIVLLVRRRLAFWVPIACAVLIPIVWFVGGGVATWGTYTAA